VRAHSVGHLPQLSWPEVCARRLERHALIEPSTAAVAEVVASICGAHAQVISAAVLSIGRRRAGATKDDLSRALWTERTLVKTFGPRGTVHLLPAADLPRWCGALGAIPPRSGLPVQARLDPAQLAAVLEAVSSALTDAELTVDELDAAVIARCGPWAGERVVPAFSDHAPRWRQALPTAAAAGVLCFGPLRGRRVSYTSPRQIVPGFQVAEARSSCAWLAHAYLHAYGPATAGQFAQWLGAPRAWAEDLLGSLATELTAVDLAGSPAWVNAGDRSTAATAVGVRLLPYFDPYIVGAHPRELLFAGRAGERAFAHGQAGTFPVVLVDGEIGGVWSHRRFGRRLQVTVELFDRRPTPRRAELESEVEQLATFLDARAELTIGPTSVGPHA
jgi:hypothetical protein